jgi:hypothetical protein
LRAAISIEIAAFCPHRVGQDRLPGGGDAAPTAPDLSIHWQGRLF